MKQDFNIDTLDEFTRAYMECALWSSDFEDDAGNTVNMDECFNIYFLAPETRETLIADCKAFQERYAELLAKAYALAGTPQETFSSRQIEFSESQAGHDFWLTRNGHGAGFWDRGLGETGEALTKVCGWKTDYPQVDLYIGDDGLIYA